MTALSYKNRYSRIVPEPPLINPSIPREHFEKLGNLMRIRDRNGSSGMDAGYVYLGQFIAHDLTKLKRIDQNPGKHGVDVKDLVQLHTAPLDLDSVYGDGFYEDRISISKKSGKMGLSKTIAVNNIPASFDDLPRYKDNPLPKIPDQRNDENFLIAQLHVLFLKLHNQIVDQLPSEMDSKSKFDYARREVTLAYQSTVIYDFLKLFLDPEVYRAVVIDRSVNIWTISESFSGTLMPIEFSGAAFRFGHSMVRRNYSINNILTQSKTLNDLFALTGKGQFGGFDGIPSDFVVDWDNFFRRQGNPVNPARIIDQLVAFSIPSIGDNETNIAIRNLARGDEINLPTAQYFIDQINLMDIPSNLKITLLSHEEYDKIGLLNKLSEEIDHSFRDHTPLWFYLLGEANFHGKGRRLGPMGSLIVGSVIVRLLESMATSILNTEIETSVIQSQPDNRVQMIDVIRAVTS